MTVFRHEKYIVYQIYRNNKKTWKNILFINHSKYIKFFQPKKWFVNYKFLISPDKKLKYFKWSIRFPGLFFEKTNCNISIGTNHKYITINY